MSLTNLTPTEIIARLVEYAKLADPMALVIPEFLPIEEGQSAAELRSELDAVAGTSPAEYRIHAVMIEDAAPGTRKYGVSNPPFDLVEEEGDSAGGLKCDAEWAFRVGVFYGYERGGVGGATTGDVCRSHFEAIADYLFKRRKLRFDCVLDHSDLQLVRSTIEPFDTDDVHVRIGVISVKLFKTVP